MTPVTTSSIENWRTRVLSHIGGTPTVKNIGKDAGVAALFAIGGWLTSEDGPLHDASPATKRLVNAAFGTPMLAKLEGPELIKTWGKREELPDFVMHGLTTAIGVLGASTNDRDMINSAAMLATLFAMAGHLEDGVAMKSLDGVKKLESIVPKTARLEGVEAHVDVGTVKPGDVMHIKAGEVVPVDGKVLRITVNGKHSELGAVTLPKLLDGEGNPISMPHNEPIPQGAVLAEGNEMLVKATTSSEKSLISRNVQFLEQAEKTPGRTVHSIRAGINNVYVPIMLAACAGEFAWSYYQHKQKHDKQMAIATGKKPKDPLTDIELDHKHWENSGALVSKGHEENSGEDKHARPRTTIDHMRKSVKRTAELAIKMAPCAIMASMLVIPFVKNALAAKHGVMIREDAALEKLKGVTHVLTDIRGTLTTGLSKFTGLHLWDEGAKALKAAAPETEHQLMGMMGKAQDAVQHEIATSVRTAAAKMGHMLELAEGETVAAVGAQGVKGQFRDGHSIMMGNKRMMADSGHALPQELLEAVEKHGGDTCYFRHEHQGQVRYGIANFTHELRPGVKEAIAEMRKDGKKVVLVSGMSQKTAEGVLAKLDCGTMPHNPIELRAECNSLGAAGLRGKDDVVREFSKGGKSVIAAIGDAENDAVFMKHVRENGGVSMAIASTGDDSTKDKASMVIEGVHQLPELIKLSKNLSHALMLNVGAAGAWMGGLIASHYAGYHVKAQTASVLHEAPTFLLTLASLGQSLRLTSQLGSVPR